MSIYEGTALGRRSHKGFSSKTPTISTKCSNPNEILHAPLTSSLNAICGDGTLTGTAFGGATISNGKLDASGGTTKGIWYPGNNLIRLGVRGTVRVKWTPMEDTDATAEDMIVFAVGAPGSVANSFTIASIPGGEFTGNAYSLNEVQDLYNPGVFLSLTAGTETEIEYGFDYTAGEDFGLGWLFAGGSLIGGSSFTLNDTSRIWTSGQRIVLGNRTDLGANANAKFRHLEVFDTVQHTSDYTPA